MMTYIMLVIGLNMPITIEQADKATCEYNTKSIIDEYKNHHGFLSSLIIMCLPKDRGQQ